jgi:hypothetical protein
MYFKQLYIKFLRDWFIGLFDNQIKFIAVFGCELYVICFMIF